MRVSRAKAAENHETVIETASRQFRAHGFDGIGLKDVMAASGLTIGGFYKRFESKEDLMAQAAARAMDQAAAEWRARIEGDAATAMARLADFYLSPRHRDQREMGCPLAALGSDAARKSPEIRASFEAGIRSHLALLQELPGDPMATLALMVGALALSRMVNDPALSDGFLQAAAEALHSAEDH